MTVLVDQTYAIATPSIVSDGVDSFI
jgi:hypothetical protein